MESVRLKKIESTFHHCIAEFCITEAKNPALSSIQITRVRLSPDLRKCYIYFVTGGSDEDNLKAKRALIKVRRYLKSKIAGSIRLKFTPELEFLVDRTLEEQEKLNEAFSLIAQQRALYPDDEEDDPQE